MVGEGRGPTIEGSGLLFCAERTPNVAAQEKLVGASGSARNDVKSNVVETLPGTKAAAAGQLGRPGGATVVGPAEGSETRSAITKRCTGRNIGWFAAGHIDFRHAGTRVSPKFSSAIRCRGGGRNESLGEDRRSRHRVRGTIDAAVACHVNAIQPGDKRVAGRILRIEHHVVHTPINRAGKIKTEALACISRANRETRSRDPCGWTGNIRQSRQSAHGLRRDVTAESRICPQANDATGGADKKSVGVAGNPQNLANGATGEETRAPRCDTIRVDVVSNRINGADQSCGRIDIFDPVETHARIAIC